MSRPNTNIMNAGNSGIDHFLLTPDNCAFIGIAPIPDGAPEDTAATFAYTSIDGPDGNKVVNYKRGNFAQQGWQDNVFTTPTNTTGIVTQLAATGVDITIGDVISANVVNGSLVLTASPTSLAWVGSVTLSHTNGNW